ncbi:MAG: ferric reductase-like transmembrane domain-containing protein [Bacteroidetes bacterium]|nr:ferric reductase-like transmembrane domain-containing protein [Bacteroidota bacterium]
MEPIAIIDISGALGLIASGILFVNMVLGMFLSTVYKKSNRYKKLPEKIKAIDVYQLHNYTAYAALVFTLGHILLIPLDNTSNFTYSNLIMPWTAPNQSNIVMLGFIALIGLLLLIITTQKVIKQKLGFRTWKNIHLVAYIMALLFAVHGLLMDPLLKDRPLDWLDAEKAFSELLLLAVIVSGYMRYQYHRKTVLLQNK